jgi:N-acetylmuramoyl-L-alanine amidase
MYGGSCLALNISYFFLPPNFLGLENRTVRKTSFHGVPGYKVLPSPKLADGKQNYFYNHWNDRPEGERGEIKTIVIHYTAASLSSTLYTFCNSKVETSSHYVISEKGEIIQVVPEEKRAWHGGPGFWKDIRGGRALNDQSIGIELVHLGNKENNGVVEWIPYSEAQIIALGNLTQQLVKKYNIDPSNVIGHSDILPQVKPDPGVLFPWKRLSEEFGVGAWVSDEELQYNDKGDEIVDVAVIKNEIHNLLVSYGYTSLECNKDLALHDVLHSFRMHFSANQHPELLNIDVNFRDLKWARGLNKKYARHKENLLNEEINLMVESTSSNSDSDKFNVAYEE